VEPSEPTTPPSAPPRQPGRREAPLERVQSIADSVVAGVVRAAPLSDEKVAFAWRAAVGPAIARASAVALSDGGRLDVRVSSEAWRRELARTGPIIRNRLSAWLGDGVVASIRVTGPSCDRPARRRRRPDG